MRDLAPAADVLSTIVHGVRDDQLDAPTPCRDTTVGDLLDHVDGLSQAFATAAAKTTPDDARPASADASRLGSDWRTRIPLHLAELAKAWHDPSAWTGMTRAGGIDLPGQVAGAVAIDEVVVHGWDLAVATSQPFAVHPGLIEAALEFVRVAVAENPQGSPGLFERPVPVPDGAPPIDRLIALTGRNPAWTPATP